ncbi:alpha/beta hydrolase [Ferruginibacter lapsinanis]|uniref:alpha/beta hydrolase n=1 Tax=Ferruginibacter lapsinanis TaxID=563172 RepID=UPI001E6418C2|nr:alpha/beta hydrolase [Ferruginibacter lapsinanis]UEG48863.1 alpha/beta hydrolase [Ferruginibacter lapsinanis]
MLNRFKDKVHIRIKGITLQGELTIPLKAKSVIVFPQVNSPMPYKLNEIVADYLQQRNIGTLIVDLLTEEDKFFLGNRSDINLFTKRLDYVTKWLQEFPSGKGCHIGYFVSGSDINFALQSAADSDMVDAIVSIESRPDLTKNHIDNVNAPTLLIAGGLDKDVLHLNNRLFKKLYCVKKMETIIGAMNLSEEPETADKVAELTATWFEKKMSPIII